MLTPKDNVFFIDWQTCFLGNPLIDVAFLLHYAVSSDILTPAFLDRVVEFYWECLVRHGVTGLSKDDCFKMYE